MGSDMPCEINVILDGDGAWPDLAEKIGSGRVVHLAEGSQIGICALPGGMASGRPSIAIRIDLPNGQTAVIETSWVVFGTAAAAIAGRYGWP
jgi:hypothetical protein